MTFANQKTVVVLSEQKTARVLAFDLEKGEHGKVGQGNQLDVLLGGLVNANDRAKGKVLRKRDVSCIDFEFLDDTHFGGRDVVETEFVDFSGESEQFAVMANPVEGANAKGVNDLPKDGFQVVSATDGHGSAFSD